MSVIDQVRYETSVRKRYAAIGFAAAVLIVVSQLIQLSGPKADVTELTLNLIVASLRTTRNIIAAVLQGIGLVGLGVLLIWMHRIAKARNPEMRPFPRYLASVGFAIDALATIILTILTGIKAHTFVTTGTQSYPEANHLVSGGPLLILSLLQELGALLLAIGFVLIALNMMRVGLLNRWLGYTGVLAGALVLFPVGGIAPIVQGLWLAAVAVLLFGRWPSGDFPAWESGLAVPWQAMQQASGAARQRREPRPREQRRRTRLGDLPTIVEPDQTPDPPAAERGPQRRKKKRRN
jgi:hypothetical protein